MLVGLAIFALALECLKRVIRYICASLAVRRLAQGCALASLCQIQAGKSYVHTDLGGLERVVGVWNGIVLRQEEVGSVGGLVQEGTRI